MAYLLSRDTHHKKSSKQTKSEDKVSIKDLISFQDDLKEDFNFDKPDEELTPIEEVTKGLYESLDKVVEEAVGKDTKKKLDEQRDLIKKVSKLQIDFHKIIALGRAIEESLIVQRAYLENHFQKDENNSYFVASNNLDSFALNENTPINERVGLAKKNLEIIKAYEDKMLGELIGKQEIAEALRISFGEILKEIEFTVAGKDLKSIKSKYKKWLTLSRGIIKSRKKAIKAVQESMEIDRIIPNHIIKNDGDLTKGISSVEINSKGNRMVNLTNEANKEENEISEERSELSTDLFGKPEDYIDSMRDNDKKNNVVKYSSLEGKAWFRFIKVVYIILWIFGVSFVLLSTMAFESLAVLLIGGLMFWVIMVLVKKAFLYIALGTG